MYRIREVDGFDDEIADTLRILHEVTFVGTARTPSFDKGWWWIAYHGDTAAAFIGMIPSTLGPQVCYFTRVGVLPDHRGHSLQRRLTRTMIAKAKRLGFTSMVTDTTDNIPSANNIIKSGFALFEPPVRWAFGNSLYWTKGL